VIPLAWEEIEELDLGQLERGENGGLVTAVVADSRGAGPGDLFVALNTGVRFVDDARAQGAATLVPRDQESALADLASLVRGKSRAQVVAVVGSAGKTTTKDVLGALCAPHVPTIRAEKSLNNEIGLPLTVCRLEPDTATLVAPSGEESRVPLERLEAAWTRSAWRDARSDGSRPTFDWSWARSMK